MSRSHASAQKPTFLLALIALGIVSRFRPAWLSVELKAAAAEHDVRAERLSRLVSRAIAAFEPLVATLTRRGRPPGVGADDGQVQTELAVTRALLETASELLAGVTLRGRRVRELVVGAYERLGRDYAVSQKRFCQALGLSARTLRHWLAHPRKQPTRLPEPDKPKRVSRPPRRGRFGFEVLLPGTQLGADTTDLSAFGVALKLIAAQDIGGRDDSLFDAVLVDDHESAELVVDVLTNALEGRPGAQAITDQGTPYMAEATRNKLEQLEVEHAPQREADPLGKSTVERALGTVKQIAEPLLAITNRVADACPVLREPSLAKAMASMTIAALLRAYQHGARAARAALNARGNIDPAELAELAEASRQRARATDRSAKLFLQHLHAAYRLAGNVTHFVRTLRRYPLAVLHEADAALRKRLLRDDLDPVRDPWRYFAAVVRNLNHAHQHEQLRRQRERHDGRVLDQRQREHHARLAAFRADPVAWLRNALDLLAMQWLPAAGALLCGGEGYGLGSLRAALRCLHAQHPHRTADLVRGTLHDFQLDHADRLGDRAIGAITNVLERELVKLRANDHCAPAAASDILTRTGKKPRPPPSDRLPI